MQISSNDDPTTFSPNGSSIGYILEQPPSPLWNGYNVEMLDAAIFPQLMPCPIFSEKRNLLSDNNLVKNKLYPITQDEAGEPKLCLDKEVKKLKGVIYEFIHVIGGGELTVEEGKLKMPDGTSIKVYVGKSQALSNRIGTYISTAKNLKTLGKLPKTSKRDQFYTALHSKPHEFYFRILEVVSHDDDINEAEIKHIKTEDAINNGYNSNSGGGGGNKIDSPDKGPPPRLIEPVTPEKTYPVDINERGRIVVNLTPRAKRIRNAVYRFKNHETGKEYVGATTATVEQRVLQHTANFNRPKNEFGKAVKQNPEAFSFGIYGQFPDEDRPKHHETNCQRKKNTLAPNGYNAVIGGNGPVSNEFIKRRKLRHSS